ncbi:putative ABC transporter ATP-binding protein YbhF [Granulosicoccus antarcticus IMCC3135]|uniref:Putative ABC transporter ATP-binding protein YbhF n=2 Tax=Granulosicoccus TaxID=437504 RepID=A0A2Z2NMP0_9GAMM|nr:putative ABC transporter ATP-binding protein YbhF [Granulosicoccus antarcticus IMCC3135]
MKQSNDSDMGKPPIISIRGLTKTYKGGHQALKGIDLEIREGEILALLGPNGAGKTTLISTICGLVTPTSGTVSVGGKDIIKDYRATRSLIGLVPQELTLGAFDVVIDTIRFSRGLFGMKPDERYLDSLLADLSLLDKKQSMVSRLSGGMKRRVLIAKALAHQPRVLFLDEPTAGVDVELRKDMWKLVEKLRQEGVTIILTTHYIEEAEEIADRVGVISDGRLLVIDEKDNLMNSLGQKQLMVDLKTPISALPDSLKDFDLLLSDDGQRLTYTFDAKGERTGITALLHAVSEAGLGLKDLNTSQSSLEDIFVNLVHNEGRQK